MGTILERPVLSSAFRLPAVRNLQEGAGVWTLQLRPRPDVCHPCPEVAPVQLCAKGMFAGMFARRGSLQWLEPRVRSLLIRSWCDQVLSRLTASRVKRTAFRFRTL